MASGPRCRPRRPSRPRGARDPEGERRARQAAGHGPAAARRGESPLAPGRRPRALAPAASVSHRALTAVAPAARARQLAACPRMPCAGPGGRRAFCRGGRRRRVRSARSARRGAGGATRADAGAGWHPRRARRRRRGPRGRGHPISRIALSSERCVRARGTVSAAVRGCTPERQFLSTDRTP